MKTKLIFRLEDDNNMPFIKQIRSGAGYIIPQNSKTNNWNIADGYTLKQFFIFLKEYNIDIYNIPSNIKIICYKVKEYIDMNHHICFNINSAIKIGEI